MTAMRAALVTGGNRGLGLETCRQLAGQGLAVTLTARRAADAAAAAQQLAGQGPGAEARALDVSDGAGIAAFGDAMAADGARIDVLVNNAGIALNGFDATVARTTLDTNFYGPLRVTEALLPVLNDGAAIVMVSSGIGSLSSVSQELKRRFLDPALTKQGVCDLMGSFADDVRAGRHREAGWPSSAYGVSKVGLNALTRVWAREFADRGIRVNAVCPGWVRTDMGGAGADRDVAKGAASIVWAAAAQGPTGGFFRDGGKLDW